MTRRRGLIASGIAMVLLLLAMSPDEGRMKDAGGPGMVPFELNGGQHRADEIMSEWGSAGRDAAREQLWIDFGFMAAYGTFLTFALGAGFDALENVCLLLTLGGAGAALPLLATIFASFKFAFVVAAIVYLIVCLAMRVMNGRQAAQAS